MYNIHRMYLVRCNTHTDIQTHTQNNIIQHGTCDVRGPYDLTKYLVCTHAIYYFYFSVDVQLKCNLL